MHELLSHGAAHGGTDGGNASAGAAAGAPGAKAMIKPGEHGAWAMLGEAAVLGLIVAPSWAGVLVAGSALAAFLARAAGRVAGRATEATRRRMALLQLVLWLALAGALLAGAVAMTQSIWLLIPVAIALVPAGLFVVLDLQAQGRSVIGECAGAIAACLVTPAIVLAGHPAARMVAGLALGYVLLRQVPGILLVRHLARLHHQRPTSATATLLAHALILLAATSGWATGLIHIPGLIALNMLLLRMAIMLLLWRPPTIRDLGRQELALGVLYIVLAAADLRMMHV